MLAALVHLIDRRLRVLHGIHEYTNSPDCILRTQIAVSRPGVVLRDGTVVGAGGRIIVLHIWNEHIPAFPPGGPTLGWARRFNRKLNSSLRELDAWLASRPDLDDVVALKADFSLVAAQRTTELVALLTKYGFEVIESPKRSLAQRVHRLGEAILIAMLVLAHNPASFRADTLRRGSLQIFISRSALRRRFAMPGVGTQEVA
jgi:hypothetical protein